MRAHRSSASSDTTVRNCWDAMPSSWSILMTGPRCGRSLSEPWPIQPWYQRSSSGSGTATARGAGLRRPAPICCPTRMSAGSSSTRATSRNASGRRKSCGWRDSTHSLHSSGRCPLHTALLQHYIETLTGETLEDVMERTGDWRDNIHPEDRERVDSLDALRAPVGHGFSAEYRRRRKDGSYIWVRGGSWCPCVTMRDRSSPGRG